MKDAEDYELDPADPSERLLNLTLVLVSTSIGMTKAEIFVAVRDYRNDRESGIKIDALNRKFERDKKELLSSGIKLETVILDADMDDNQETRYRINPSGFQWPKNTKLTAKQLQLLQLASTVWRQASLSSDAASGLDRLRALGTASPSSNTVAFAPRIKTHSRAFVPLTNAITARKQVSFEYRKAQSDKPEMRTLQPWRISHIENQWLVQGWDVEKQAFRNFLLKRIVSDVKTSEDLFDAPTQGQIDDLQADLDNHIASNVATLQVKRDSLAWFHFDPPSAGSGDTAEIKVQFMDLDLLADELRDYAGEITVIEPSALEQAIRLGFEKVAAAHV
jgi:proteasome accessory factor B